MHRLQELVRLHRMGEGAREVARLLGMGPNTERQYREAIEQAGLLEGDAEQLPELDVLRAAVLAHAPPKPAPQQQSSLAMWRAEIEKLAARGLGPSAIRDRLRIEQPDFRGSRSSIHRMLASIARERGVSPADVVIPVETAPGDVAQVDFGYVGHRWDPETKRLRRAWVFVMVLGHSRHMFADVVFDQRTETWLQLHAAAFRSFGGVPRTIVPDNLKAAVVRAAFAVDDDAALNRSYRHLARHYGFTVDPAPPRAAEKKGKVEAGVKYVKRNALAGRDGEDVAETRRALARWISEIAGERRHGTTGEKPLEVFERTEKDALLPLPTRPYSPVTFQLCTVHRDCHVEVGGRLYSVPWTLVGHKLWVQVSRSSVVVEHNDQVIARHDRRGPGHRSTRDEHLPAERALLRHRSREYWEQRADAVGQDVGLYVREVFEQDDVLSQLRKVQAIVAHLEKFPPERAQAACRRASLYGAYGYHAVRDILRNALDFEPLPGAAPTETPSDVPRFARDVGQLVAARLAAAHDTGGAHEHA